MKQIWMNRRTLSVILVSVVTAVFVCSCGGLSGRFSSGKGDILQVLIITGRNNHAWQKTTPELKKIYEQSGKFAVDVTTEPEKLTAAALIKYDVIVSNWTAWPEVTGHQWGAETEKAIEDFVAEGKGLVIFHAASSSFYDWPAYQQMVGANWDMEHTGHPPIQPFKVKIKDKEHPITKGMEDFWITDEMWHRMARKDHIKVLCEAFSVEDKRRKYPWCGTGRNEPMVICTDFGRGRCFYNVLGHDVASMRNAGWRSLMLRGTQWAATGKVTIPVQTDRCGADYNFKHGDNWIALTNNGRIVWRFNYDKKEGKPYFHPVSLTDGTVLTWLRPPDHAWHRALWFSWKYLNGVNYWEENKEGVSKGLTEIKEVKVFAQQDYSGRIEVLIEYHEPEKPALLRERRIIEISRPDERGNYYMDWHCTFTACETDVVLDRTPIPGQKGGQSWGGYAGLGIRFSKLIKDWQFVNSEGQKDLECHGQNARWIDLSGDIGGGQIGGVAMLDHPENLRHPSPWHIVHDLSIFGFFNPALLFNAPYTLGVGDSLRLRYRVIIHPDRGNREMLERHWRQFSESPEK